MADLPLRRNRDFLLLQSGQLLSHAGTQLTAIAYPLLVLAVTGSAAKAGVVAAARMVALALFTLPSGLAADHWSRRRLMIGADGVRVLALGALGVALLAGDPQFWAIALVAFVEGAGAAVFAAAHPGALRSVVAPTQLPAATSVQLGRQAAMNLAGPPLGGALFGVARSLPFVVDAVSYAFSSISLLLMRTPFQEVRERDTTSLRSRVTEGFRFLWSHPFLRTCALLFGLANFIGPGLILAVVVLGKRDGLTGGEIGLLLSSFGACVLLGSFLSSLLRRLLPIRGILLLELCTWPGCALYLVWPSVYVLMAGLLPTALVIPSTDSVVHGYRIAMTPDRLLGRAESARSVIALLVAPLGPLVAGALLETASARATIAFFATCSVALALWGILSPSIRAAPSLDELGATPMAEKVSAVDV